jgi:hypothetical protein
MQSPLKKEYYEEEKPVLTLIKNDNTLRKDKEQYYLYYNSGVFPILLFIILFLCIAVIINIGLRIQNISHDRAILNLNQAISAEKDRSDRLSLKISQLKAPSVIIAAIDEKNATVLTGDNEESGAGIIEDQNMKIKEQMKEDAGNSAEFRELDVFYSQTAKDMKIASGNAADLKGDYNKNKTTDNLNFKAVTGSIKEVLLVVSEGILTFFIP